MPGPIEEINSVKSKRKSSVDAWSEYLSGLGNFLTQPIINNHKEDPKKDSISSAAKVSSTTTATSSSDLVKMSTRVWDFFASPIVNNVEGDKGVKPAPIGGAPVLEPPFQVDKKLFAQLIKELQDILKKIAEAYHEKEDELRESAYLILMNLIDYLKKQKIIREDGARDLKNEIIFRSNKGRELAKEINDTKTLEHDIAKDQRFWGKVNKYVTWGALAVTAVAIASVAIPAIFASGGSLSGPLMAAGKIGLQITQSLLGVTSGCTQLMKANLDRKVGIHKEKGMILQEAHTSELTKITGLNQQMKDWFGKSLTISGWLRQVAHNDRQANLDMISISPPAPAA